MDEATKSRIVEDAIKRVEQTEADIATWPVSKKMYETCKIMLDSAQTLQDGWAALGENLGRLKEEEVPEALRSEMMGAIVTCYRNSLNFQEHIKSIAAMTLVTGSIAKYSEKKEPEKTNGSNN